MTLTSTQGAALIDPLALAALRRRFAGELLTPDMAAFQRACLLVNGRFDRKPALVARARHAQDVAQAVIFAREHGLQLAMRSGGHGIPSYSSGDGVLLIDLSAMKQIAISQDHRSARVQPGVTNGELVVALGAEGLATTTGTCASVSMGGSTFGGGIGWLTGRFGATVDNVLAFEVVTAEGAIITASAHEHPDLFWALRGGGNFGVVTQIVYRVHELGPVLGGPTIFHLAAAPLALRMYRELTSRAPDELIAHAAMTTVPDLGSALIVQAVYSGEDLAAGERLLAPLRRFGPPAIDLIAPRSYAETSMMLTPPLPPGARWSETAYTLTQPSDAALDDLVSTALDRPSPLPVVNIHQIHGAAARVASDATAFALREAHYAVVNIGMWVDGSGEAETTWTWRAKARMAPHASEEGQGAIRPNDARLARVKAEYDPENIFRSNQNLRPS